MLSVAAQISAAKILTWNTQHRMLTMSKPEMFKVYDLPLVERFISHGQHHKIQEKRHSVVIEIYLGCGFRLDRLQSLGVDMLNKWGTASSVSIVSPPVTTPAAVAFQLAGSDTTTVVSLLHLPSLATRVDWSYLNMSNRSKARRNRRACN